MIRHLPFIALTLLMVACGGPVPSGRAISLSQALTGVPELLEFEPAAVRAELRRDIMRASLSQSGQPARAAVIFPIVREGAFVGAPALPARMDLLSLSDAGASLAVTFDTKGERWGEDRRDATQGLSEREAAELVARCLIQAWGLNLTGTVVLERSSGAPYAAAYLDGILRINPVLIYLAASDAP